MKLLVLVFMMVAGLISGLSAQQRATVVAKGETALENELPQEMLFAFDGFKKASIIRKNGFVNETRINLNLFSKKLLFLNDGNQVMELAFPEQVEKIIVEGKEWYPVEGTFGEVLHIEGDYMLIKLRQTVIGDTRREGGFGSSSSTSAVIGLSTMYNENGMAINVLPVGEYDFETRTVYRIVSPDRTSNANLRGFRNVFSGNRRAFNDLVNKHSIDFDNEEDLVKLLKLSVE